MGYCPDKGHLAVAESTQGCQRPEFWFRICCVLSLGLSVLLCKVRDTLKGFKAIQSKQVVPFGPLKVQHMAVFV